jgi:hypothetical protein
LKEEKSTMRNSVSVIIPTYNRSGLVARAIKSVLAAMSPGDEVLVVDDGSTDDTEAVVRSFGDTIRYVRIKNSGPGAARNLGIELAKCPFLTFLDSDDEWLPDKLDLQRKVMEQYPGVVFCFGNLSLKRRNGEILHDAFSYFRADVNVGAADIDTPLAELLGPGVPFSSIAGLPAGRGDFNIHVGDMYPVQMDVHYVTSDTVMVRKELADASFRYPGDVRLMEDWECFARLSKIGPAAYLDCELAVWVDHAGFRLTDVDSIRHATRRMALLQRVWGADEQFLGAHAARYQSLLKTQYLKRSKFMIRAGQLKEAKEDLRVAGGPLSYRLLTSLPSGLVRNILGVERRVRRLRNILAVRTRVRRLLKLKWSGRVQG